MIEVVVEPGAASRNYWRDLWRYRELFQVLAWRDADGKNWLGYNDPLWIGERHGADGYGTNKYDVSVHVYL